MIEDKRGRVDYDEYGAGPAIVFVPGSCSTGAAYRPIIAALDGRFRCITTSLLGYGGTAERRTASDVSIAHEAEAIEAVLARAGSPVHLVGHSFGGLSAVAVALRKRMALASLTILEAPAVELLRACGEGEHYRTFRQMSASYFGAFEDGSREAIAAMIDFYGGAGTYASWPPRVRAYAIETTPVNILDWATAYEFCLEPDALADINIPTLVIWGSNSNPAAQRANFLLGQYIPRATSAVLDGAAHFMISTHPGEVAERIARHVAIE